MKGESYIARVPGQFASRFCSATVQQETRQGYIAVCIILWSIISYLFFKSFVLLPVEVEGSSMHPTLSHGDRYIVNRLVYHCRSPRRGEIVVIRDPIHKSLCVKRVIGIPQDVVRITEDGVYINSEKLHEPYLSRHYSSHPSIRDEHPTYLKEDYYFVLGDNRPVSEDSRTYGAIHRKNIIGLIPF